MVNNIIDRNSRGYQAGRLCGRLLLLGLGYIVGKRWGQKPIERSFPEKKNNLLK